MSTSSAEKLPRPSIEQPGKTSAPEQSSADRERTPEGVPTAGEQPQPSTREVSVPTSAPVSHTPTPAKSQIVVEIESILEEDLEALYRELTEPERVAFAQKGEQIAGEVRSLLGEVKVRVREIFQLLVEWLQLLPGVNQSFIEQEAKRKTDKLMRLRSRQ